MSLRFVAVCLLVIAAPFEPRLPLAAVAGLSITFTELAWTIAAAMWAASWGFESRPPRWRSPVTLPLVGFLAAMALAALVADAESANAFKATARLTVMVVTAWMVASSLPDVTRFAGLLSVALGTGAVVASLAIAEVVALARIDPILLPFRDHARFVGAEVRASSTLQYPTIAAAYLTAILCLGLGLCLWLRARGRQHSAAVVLGLLVVLAVGVSLTLTRAAIVAALAGLGAVAWALIRARAPRSQVTVVAVCAICMVVSPVVTASAEMSQLRWSSEGRGGWYRAVFDAPVAVEGRPGALLDVPVIVTNDGRRTWSRDSDPPMYLSYHVVDPVSLKVVRYDGVRTALPGAVPPGDQVRAHVRVRLPLEPGDYRVAWDMVHERRLWFGAEPGAPRSYSRLTVAGPPVDGAAAEPRASSRAPLTLASATEPPGRRVLWRAAMNMAAEAPLTGAGPDNFRLTSARFLGAQSDPRVHSNNVYLEVLTGGGLLALIPFLALLVRAAGLARRQFGRLGDDARAAYAGACAAGVAWLAHGMLDAFFMFTPTLLMTGVVLGLIVAPSWWTLPTRAGAGAVG